VNETDIPLLISMLAPVVELPHYEATPLKEGYSHELAMQLLLDLREKAQPALLEVIKKGERNRREACDILARQGVMEAVDLELAADIKSDSREYALLQAYLPYRGPADIVKMRQWYRVNKNNLIFDASVRMWKLRNDK